MKINCSLLSIILPSVILSQFNVYGRDLSLQEAMDLAAQYSFSGKIAKASLDESMAREDQTLRTMGPRFDFEAQRIWFSKSVNSATGKTIGTTKVPSRVTTAAFTVAQPIIGLGTIFLKLQADALATAVVKDEEQMSERDARFLGAESFLRAQKADNLTTIAQASLTVVEKQKADAEALMRSGRLSQVDLLRLELAAVDAKNQLAQAQTTREIALFALAEVLGLKISDGISLKSPEVSAWEKSKNKLPQFDEVSSVGFKNRPELKSIRSKYEIAQFYSRAAELDYMPSLNAFAKYERDFEATDIDLPGINPASPKTLVHLYDKKEVQDRLSYGLMLKWNIWDWGVRQGRINEFSATLVKADTGRQALESKIRIEIMQSILELRSTSESLETAKTSIKLAEEVYRLSVLRFKNGTASASDLVSAERDQTRARAGLTVGRADLDLAWLKVQKSLGQQLSIK